MMPIPPTSSIPNLIEKVFEKYELTLKNKSDNTRWTNSYKKFLIELDVLFHEVLPRALKILDEQKITLYATAETNIKREIAEIIENKSSAYVIKLYPRVNFCYCAFFQRNVLALNLNNTTTNCFSQQKRLQNNISPSYTCEHVLALRLALLLKPPTFNEEILPKQKFNVLSGQMLD